MRPPPPPPIFQKALDLPFLESRHALTVCFVYPEIYITAQHGVVPLINRLQPRFLTDNRDEKPADIGRARKIQQRVRNVGRAHEELVAWFMAHSLLPAGLTIDDGWRRPCDRARDQARRVVPGDVARAVFVGAN